MTPRYAMSAFNRTVTSRQATVAAIKESGAIAIIRLSDGGSVAKAIDALVRGGVRAIEVTMTVPNAIASIAEIAAKLPPHVVLGAGTLLDEATAEDAIRAGARFVVSPIFEPAVLGAARRNDVPAMPGCYTPTEIVGAVRGGADLVKVFPARSLGSDFIRDLLAPLPSLDLVPTGGISIDGAGEWIRAGAAAVGVGGALVDPRAIAAGNFDAIARNAERLVTNIRAAEPR